MSKTPFLLLLTAAMGPIGLCAQLAPSDSTAKTENIKEVVVTASRTEMDLENVPVPMSVVTKEEIANIGAPRLTDVLREQTGVQIVSGHGTGVQMQGMGSDYVMIMVNGEPLIGRTAGTLDLDRIAVGNIKRIEILKGPASALYGSEAMAGVINIITEKSPEGQHLNLSANYRKFNTSDFNIDYGVKKKNLNTGIVINRFASDGIKLEQSDGVQIAFPATTAYTVSPYAEWQLQKKWKLDVSARLYDEQQASIFTIAGAGDVTQNIIASGHRKEYTMLPKLIYTPNLRNKIQLRQYATYYQFEDEMNYESDGALYSSSIFTQQFFRTELQHDYFHSTRHTLTSGIGYAPEMVEATRYADEGTFRAAYVFVQHSWQATNKLHFLYGGRYDLHSAYRNRLSPKFATQYKVTKKLSINASLGGGYKAPDFRHLLLDFTNPIAGYSVFGARTANRRISEMQDMGLIEAMYFSPDQIQDLRPEHSMAYNLGWRYAPVSSLCFTGNFFYNNISDLIETTPVARNINGSNIFSYRNIARVQTYGAEFNANYTATKNWSFATGYEYLRAEDLDVLEQIENGEIFRRNAQGVTERIERGDYFGLFNRARHSGNVKVTYSNNSGWNVSLRTIYRGPFPFGDINGNNIADVQDELAAATVLLNMRVSKTIYKKFLVETGVMNLLGQVNRFEPTVAGRIWFAGLKMNLNWEGK